MLFPKGALEEEAVVSSIIVNQLMTQEGVQQGLIRVGVPH